MLSHYQGKVEETALLDSRAMENFIDHTTVIWLWLETKKLEKPWIVFNVDGSINKHGTVTHACDLMVSHGTRKEQQYFYIMNLGKDRFIFGFP
jgi:hypothetical protein